MAIILTAAQQSLLTSLEFSGQKWTDYSVTEQGNADFLLDALSNRPQDKIFLLHPLFICAPNKTVVGDMNAAAPGRSRIPYKTTLDDIHVVPFKLLLNRDEYGWAYNGATVHDEMASWGIKAIAPSSFGDRDPETGLPGIVNPTPMTDESIADLRSPQEVVIVVELN